MLSGISHDLRTPLTRLKLQLELIDQKEITKKMSSDIDEMERMLNDYLKFAKTQSQEKTERIDVSELIQDLCKTIDSDRVLFENKDKIFLQGENMLSQGVFQI